MAGDGSNTPKALGRVPSWDAPQRRAPYPTASAHMTSLRICLLLTAIASFISTVVAETVGIRALIGCFSGAVIGLLWAIFLRYASQHEADEWKQMTENITEAQHLIDEIRGHVHDIYGLSPRALDGPSGLFETLSALPVVALFFAIGYVLALNTSVYSYVLDLQRPIPPEPKTLLLYVGFLFSFSAAFLGLSSKLLVRLFPRKHHAAPTNAH